MYLNMCGRICMEYIYRVRQKELHSINLRIRKMCGSLCSALYIYSVQGLHVNTSMCSYFYPTLYMHSLTYLDTYILKRQRQSVDLSKFRFIGQNLFFFFHFHFPRLLSLSLSSFLALVCIGKVTLKGVHLRHKLHESWISDY